MGSGTENTVYRTTIKSGCFELLLQFCYLISRAALVQVSCRRRRLRQQVGNCRPGLGSNNTVDRKTTGFLQCQYGGVCFGTEDSINISTIKVKRISWVCSDATSSPWQPLVQVARFRSSLRTNTHGQNKYHSYYDFQDPANWFRKQKSQLLSCL